MVSNCQLDTQEHIPMKLIKYSNILIYKNSFAMLFAKWLPLCSDLNALILTVWIGGHVGPVELV